MADREFEAAVVRGRGARDGRARLQALRKRATLRVSELGLVLVLGRGREPVTRVQAADVKAVQVKRRLVRVRKESEALTLRFDTQEDAIEAASAMMDAWNIDPSIQTTAQLVENIPDMQESLQKIASEYLANPELRQSIHCLHEQLSIVLARSAGDSDELATV